MLDAESNAATYDLMLETMNFIQQQSHLPNQDVAFAGALSLMAAVCGRAYEVSGTGLNMYTVLLAQTGAGKSEAANGIDKILNAVVSTVPAAATVVAASRVASAPALIKQLALTPSCLVILGECGQFFQQLSNPRTPPHLLELKGLLLDVYSKSGPGQMLRPSIYSDKEKNTSAVFSPALTILGESTAEEYDKALNEQSIQSGLLPRMFVIESKQKRPAPNDQKVSEPSKRLAESWATLIAHCQSLSQSNRRISVQLSVEASIEFQDFDEECRVKINSADKDVTRQLWNRAHIKALKVAALLATGQHPYAPEITSDVARWAISLEKKNTKNQIRKFETGEVGEQARSEQAQQQRVRAAIKQWITEDWSKVQRYVNVSAKIHAGHAIPYSFISKRLTSDAAFRDSRLGSTETLKRTLAELVKFGEIAKVNPADAHRMYETRMDLYVVTQPDRILNA